MSRLRHLAALFARDARGDTNVRRRHVAQETTGDTIGPARPESTASPVSIQLDFPAGRPFTTSASQRITVTTHRTP